MHFIILSDLNNLEVVTTTAEKYETAFGFTEEEVFAALDEQGLGNKKEQVKLWYDGFIFGNQRDIYNPWSILNFLDKDKFDTYWANTSSNNLVSKLLREGRPRLKETFEELIQGRTVRTSIDEQIVFSQLELTLTNLEVHRMFRSMIHGWFAKAEYDYNDFIKALLAGDLEAMNGYMNHVALQTFSYFDTGKNPSAAEPERFYHGFVLGLIIELSGRYAISSNRESGYGRYDVMLEPKRPAVDNAIILEFKVFSPSREKDLNDTVASALQQIEDKQYSAMLIQKGIPENCIRKYGFAFQGNHVLIGS